MGRSVPAEGSFSCKRDRKSTRLNSSHLVISYAVFCLKKKKKYRTHRYRTHHELPDSHMNITLLSSQYDTLTLSHHLYTPHVAHIVVHTDIQLAIHHIA